MCIDVADAFGVNPRVFYCQSHAARRPLTLGRWRRDMVGVAVGPVADDFGVNRRPSLASSLPLLEHQYPRTFGNDEAVSFFIKRAAGAFGIVVARGKRFHRAEPAHAKWGNRGFRTARNHRVLDPAPNQVKGLANRMSPRRTSGSRGPVDTLGSIADSNLTRSQVGNNFGNKKGRDFSRAAVKICPMIGLQGFQTQQANANNYPDALRLIRRNLQTAVLDRHFRGADTVLDEAIHLLDLARLDIIFCGKVCNFAGDARREELEVGKTRDRPDPRAPGNQCIPVLLYPGSQGSDQPQPSDYNPTVFIFIHEPTRIKVARIGHHPNNVNRAEREPSLPVFLLDATNVLDEALDFLLSVPPCNFTFVAAIHVLQNGPDGVFQRDQIVTAFEQEGHPSIAALIPEIKKQLSHGCKTGF